MKKKKKEREIKEKFKSSLITVTYIEQNYGDSQMVTGSKKQIPKKHTPKQPEELKRRDNLVQARSWKGDADRGLFRVSTSM